MDITGADEVVISSQQQIYPQGVQFHVVQPQTGTHAVTVQKGYRDFSAGGLCMCCRDVPGCCFGCWCPWCLLCSLSARMDEGCCGCWWPSNLRTKMRGMLGIQGSVCGDACATCWCPSCVICQMDRELKAVGL